MKPIFWIIIGALAIALGAAIGKLHF